MSNKTSGDNITELLKNTASKLMEHGDSVQILMTARNGESTVAYSVGEGNWYARQGLARRFILLDEAQDKAACIAGAINPS